MRLARELLLPDPRTVLFSLVIAVSGPVYAKPALDTEPAEQGEKCVGLVAGTEITPLQMHHLQQYGSQTLSYSAFQPGLSHFTREEGTIAYKSQFFQRLVLGDPLVSEENLPALIDAFLKEHHSPFFCAITRKTAEVLAARGFLINEMGRDLRIDLENFNIDGADRAKLRLAHRKYLKSKHKIVERTTSEVDREAVEDVTKVWRKGKSVSDKEVRFLTRPIVYEDEIGVRKFYDTFLEEDATDGKEKERVAASYFFDPIYRGGRLEGHSLAFKRRLPSALPGIEEAMIVEAAQIFKNEGLKWLYAGMIPMYKVEDREFSHSWSMRTVFLNLVKYGDGVIFNFTGHADFKHRLRGEEIPLYIATRVEFNLLPLLRLLGACGLSCPPNELARLLGKAILPAIRKKTSRNSPESK